MSRRNTIPTPLHHRLHRFSRTILPVVGFATTFILMAWLWRQARYLPNIIGEVEAIRIDIASGSDGILAPLSHLDGGQWSLFDRVNHRDIIARLDDKVVQSSLATMQAELDRLKAGVDAERARLALEDTTRQMDHHRERMRLAWQMESHRIDWLKCKVLIEVDRVEQERLAAQLKYLEPLQTSRTVTASMLADTQYQYDAVTKQIEANEVLLAEIEQQRQQAEARLQELPAVAESHEKGLLAPLQAAVTVQEKTIQGIHVEIDGLTIRAPISGTITTIYKRPGQVVAVGEPILTIAAEEGRHIVSYIRGSHIQPQIGSVVRIRRRIPGAPQRLATVERIGPQVEPVPAHHLLDPNSPEWGLPIWISFPASCQARPGELVDLALQPDRGPRPLSNPDPRTDQPVAYQSIMKIDDSQLIKE